MATEPPITKAVIAAAGFGTRFLPQTKAIPKEMLPLIDKPVIQYIVEELVAVGVKDIIIVTGYTKRAIEDHFDKPNEDLLNNLRQGGPAKAALLKEVEKIADLANFIYLRQKGPYGTATPLLNAEHLINGEPFFYTWSDDFFKAQPLRFQQMIDAYEKYQCPILSALRTDEEADYDRYGFAGGRPISRYHTEITDIIEKPGRAKAPSNLATVSGFILTPEVFDYFHKCRDNLPDGQELYANDALKLMIEDGQKIVACEIKDGHYYDIGNKLSYLKTVFDFALDETEVKEELTSYLKIKLKRV